MNTTIKYTIGLFWLVLGIPLVLILDILTKPNSDKWKFLDSIYGNRVDSINGDDAYIKKVKTLRRYRWCQLRNPVNNYLRTAGPNGNVHNVKTTTDTIIGLRRTTRALELTTGKVYKLYQIKVFNKLYLLFGYMLLEDHRPSVNSRLDFGHHFENRMLLSPIKFKSLPL